MYTLRDCPAGFQLINTTSNGVFSHRLQQCSRCLPDQYIVNPNSDVCQQCPTGAFCGKECALQNPSFACQDGSKIVGTWNLNPLTGLYRLDSCPPGYSLNAQLQLTQRCSACTQGQYIIDPDRDQCQQCPGGEVSKPACFGLHLHNIPCICFSHLRDKVTLFSQVEIARTQPGLCLY